MEGITQEHLVNLHAIVVARPVQAGAFDEICLSGKTPWDIYAVENDRDGSGLAVLRLDTIIHVSASDIDQAVKTAKGRDIPFIALENAVILRVDHWVDEKDVKVATGHSEWLEVQPIGLV